jgi:hypothetical protein
MHHPDLAAREPLGIAEGPGEGGGKAVDDAAHRRGLSGGAAAS